MCAEYVQCFKALDRCMDLVLARVGFPGKCSGEMGVGVVCRWCWAGKGVGVLSRKLLR